MVDRTERADHYTVEWEVFREMLTVASAEARRRQHEAEQASDVTSACTAAYEAGRIDEAKQHLNPTDLAQMQQIADRWAKPDAGPAERSQA